MTRFRFWLTPTGALLASIGFFLPWIVVSCQPNPKRKPLAKVQISGYHLATGQKPPNVNALFDNVFTGMMIKSFLKRMQKKSKGRFKPFAKKTLLWGALASMLILFALGLWYLLQQQPVPKWLGILLLIAATGFLIAGLMQHMPSSTGNRSFRVKLPKSIVYQMGAGGWLWCGGALLAIIGLWFPSKQTDVTEQTNEKKAEETGGQAQEET
jgi:hypothetical protein